MGNGTAYKITATNWSVWHETTDESAVMQKQHIHTILITLSVWIYRNLLNGRIFGREWERKIATTEYILYRKRKQQTKMRKLPQLFRLEMRTFEYRTRSERRQRFKWQCKKKVNAVTLLINSQTQSLIEFHRSSPNNSAVIWRYVRGLFWFPTLCWQKKKKKKRKPNEYKWV